jgi:hypothetical protein
MFPGYNLGHESYSTKGKTTHLHIGIINSYHSLRMCAAEALKGMVLDATLIQLHQ